MQAQQVLSIRVCDIDLNAMFCVHYVGNKFKEALIEVGTKNYRILYIKCLYNWVCRLKSRLYAQSVTL